MTTEQAIVKLRSDQDHSDEMRNSYLGPNVVEEGQRFLASEEFKAVLALLGDVRHKVVMDLGAGTGIGTFAFAMSGADKIYALEPDPSDIVGRGAMARLVKGLPVEEILSYGEEIPLPAGSIDIVYCRQVLHHTRDLKKVLCECARVLKSGGIFIACREHVADDDAQLAEFLRSHPVHQLAGGEHAFKLAEYKYAITGAGLMKLQILQPWDSIINAYPVVKSADELVRLPARIWRERFGLLGIFVNMVPAFRRRVIDRLNAIPRGGRMYSFLAVKT